jgi:hypothetical protein
MNTGLSGLYSRECEDEMFNKRRLKIEEIRMRKISK